jgi:hypothetical protein
MDCMGGFLARPQSFGKERKNWGDKLLGIFLHLKVITSWHQPWEIYLFFDAWSGGGLTILSQYVCGSTHCVEKVYSNAMVPFFYTAKAQIKNSKKNDDQYNLIQLNGGTYEILYSFN